MKINISQVIIGIDGIKPLPNPEKNGIDLTLRDIILQGLVSFQQGEPEKNKAECYRLFINIRNSKRDTLEFTAEELAVIKKKIGHNYGALVMGQAWDMIEK